MSSKPWLVSVCAGPWQRAGILAAKELGVRVLALDGDPQAAGFAHADAHQVVDIRNPDAVLKAVASQGIVPDAAVCFVAEAGQMATAAIREAYDLPGARQPVVKRLTDKAAMRSTWQAHGLPGPNWRLCRTAEDARDAVAALGWPAIVKPIDSAGSRGVSKLDALSGFDEAVASAFAATLSGKIIVESFLPGTEYTVECFSARDATWALAVTEKRKVAGTGDTVAIELATPNLPDPEITKIANLAQSCLSSIDYRDGPSHTEIMRGPDGGLGLIETAGRAGGFMVAEGLVPAASGFDLATATVQSALGMSISPPNDHRNAICLRFIPSTPGRVIDWRGIAEANTIAGVQAGSMVERGQVVGKPNTDGGRLAYILATGATRAEVDQKADAAEQHIKFELTEIET